MEYRQLGRSGLRVSCLTLGTMTFGGQGQFRDVGETDLEGARRQIDMALDAGVNLIDTADFYGSGANEILIARALKERRREDVILSVKFGSRRTPDGGFQPVPYDVSPVAVKDRLAYSLRRLNTDYIDIYRPSRLHPDIPVEETVGALEEMRQAGYIRHIGLSELGADTIRRAAAVAPISDLQIEYSLLSRGPETSIIPTLRELGIGLTAYGVLSRGLLSGHWNPARELTSNDFRAHSPRFQGDNLEANLRLVDALGEVAQRLGATTSQVAIAWVAAQDESFVPLVGARRRERLTESLGAVGLTLDDGTLKEIEEAIPQGAASGARYAAPVLATLDSEH
jgi:aryl-alcohol dehydrogenase-like predicted oxidoreductase